MPQSKETRAIQHLLLQGFEVMPLYAAVAVLFADRARLDRASVTWAAYADSQSFEIVKALPDSEPLKAGLVECANRSVDGVAHVLCVHQGALLVTELDASGPVATARARIENAVALGKAPPPERLEAFGDADIAAEFERRQRKNETPATPVEEAPNGT